MYLEECPVQRFIPIYLVVGGSVAVFMNLCGLIQAVYHLRDPESVRSLVAVVLCGAGVVIGCFTSVWFTLGAYSDDQCFLK